MHINKGVGRKISRGKRKKTRPKNITIKPPSTLSVSFIKIQEGVRSDGSRKRGGALSKS